MNYFVNPKPTTWFSIIPPAFLPIFYKEYLEYLKFQNLFYFSIDQESYLISDEIPFILYLTWWRLSSFLIIDVIEDKLSYDKGEIKINNKLTEDLGADSLDIVEIYISLEKLLDISINTKLEFERVSDLIDYIFMLIIVNVNNYQLGWPKDSKATLLYL